MALDEKLQDDRVKHAVRKLEILGYETTANKTTVQFLHNGAVVTFYPYTGWHTGRTITDGRGLQNLLKQLKK